MLWRFVPNPVLGILVLILYYFFEASSFKSSFLWVLCSLAFQCPWTSFYYVESPHFITQLFLLFQSTLVGNLLFLKSRCWTPTPMIPSQHRQCLQVMGSVAQLKEDCKFLIPAPKTAWKVFPQSFIICFKLNSHPHF